MPMYNNPYLNNYNNGYYPSYSQQQPNYNNNYGYQSQPTQNVPVSNATPSQTNYMPLTFVNNLEEATKYTVFPNTSIYLRENSSNKLYIKSCDSTGKTNLEVYELVKPSTDTQNSPNLAQNTQPSVFISKQDLDALETKFDSKLAKLQSRLDKLQVKKIIEE